MKISLNTMRELTGLELPSVGELTEKLNRQLGGVEEIVDLGKKYKDAVIVKIIKCEKHPGADKLSVCQIDVGQDELVQVVCGAKNAREGLWTVWLPPQSIVPSSYNNKDQFVLEIREIRGVVSNGMLAAGDELAINNDHVGIVEITENDLPQAETLQTGANFAEVFGLNDVIIEIENKMFTHRPDCFGQIGVAREISGIYGQKFEESDWYWKFPEFKDSFGLNLEVFNDCPDKAPRFMAVTMKNVKVQQSPLWLQITLMRWGGKTINSVVDLTNYIMLLTAQPTHAYDYDKLHNAKLGVRLAKSGEKAKLLNDKTYELDEEDIVIVDGKEVVGLAGVMGGANSEVSADTKNIVLECANFDMYTVRRSSMRHGLFTDALTRFNKGQSSVQNDRVLAELMRLCTELSGAEQASKVFDEYDQGKKENDLNKFSKGIFVDLKFINDRLGLDLQVDEFCEILRRVNFACVVNDKSNKIEVAAPFFRTDIEIPEDVVEEVGRLYGFDKLPQNLPKRTSSPTTPNQIFNAKQEIREILAKSGGNEVLTYSFVHQKLIKNAEQDISQAFTISNALSPDLQYYRLTVLASLLDKVHANIKAGHDEFMLFEIGKGHNKKYHAADDNGLPSEMNFVDMVYANKNESDSSPLYKARRIIDFLAKSIGVEVVAKPADIGMDYPVTAPFDLSRSAMVYTTGDEFIGMIGELKTSVIRNFKLPQNVSAATLDLESLAKVMINKKSSYQPLSKYPSIFQDITLEVDEKMTYEELRTELKKALESIVSQRDMSYKLDLIDIYAGQNTINKKRLTFRLIFVSSERTLTVEHVNQIMLQIAEELSKFNIKRV